ncbi:tyrosine-type recombinase/integrase [Microcoleus sp. CAWBG58]|uniref:tyrosine-type recombinase/integrase n=1 Tax=Microcoleus sp. CAWBG58 TaxID=2841651 RepID=UPI0025F67455|nr:tyrosine-type recombinase/integrase [Microcoleus sp. CAWBG58]
MREHGEQCEPINQSDYEAIYERLHTDIHKCFLAIAWYTGSKPSSILKSKVSQFYVDPSNQVVRSRIIPSTKEIPCHKDLKEILGRYRCLKDGFLFPSRVCQGRHLSRQAFDKAFKKALREAELEQKGYSLCSLRIGFIARLADIGCRPELIEHLSGLKNGIASLSKYKPLEEQIETAIANF